MHAGEGVVLDGLQLLILFVELLESLVEFLVLSGYLFGVVLEFLLLEGYLLFQELLLDE